MIAALRLILVLLAVGFIVGLCTLSAPYGGICAFGAALLFALFGLWTLVGSRAMCEPRCKAEPRKPA